MSSTTSTSSASVEGNEPFSSEDDPQDSDDEPQERFEQQNIVLPMSTKAHLARLAGSRGMSLRRYISEVVVAEHVAQAREELRQMYLRDMAMLEQSIDDLPGSSTTVKGKRKRSRG